MKKLKAFTLIEMLIVIVIIGILAAALIPRLSKARGRANDTARKADLSQIAAALVSAQIDKGSFPSFCGDLSLAESDLSTAWLDSLPTDPAGATVNYFSWFSDNWQWHMTPWQYWYCALTKNWQSNWWFVIAAISETEWWANYVQCEAINDAWTTAWTPFNTIQDNKCTTFTSSTTCDSSKCQYVEWEWQLRYIYTQ